ncbi:hypothetical protein CHCC20331_4289 [Bacillus paralicheniformis]|nr:hypothetical protein CHCC20348_3302 [Bacillus paralicheniformis]TWK81816.1 hypothetical protein CHCC20331_4289 [Bacillus paralicheniformis]
MKTLSFWCIFFPLGEEIFKLGGHQSRQPAVSLKQRVIYFTVAIAL